MKIAQQRIFWYFLLATILFMGFFYGLASYPIHDNNEGLYAEIAREMLACGHYVIPHLNGVPYIEKPPLFYWLILLSYKLFDVSVFAARIVPPILATTLCLTILWFSHKLQRPMLGIISVLILSSSIGFIIIGRVIFFDMTLTTFLCLTLFNFYLWHQQKKPLNLYLSYFFLSLAFLTKGLVAIAIAGPVALLFLSFSGSGLKEWQEFFKPGALALFFSIFGLWLMLACKTSPHFAWDFFINENWYRFLGKRIPMDYYHGPLYYYIPRLFIYLFPWLFLVPCLFGKIKRPLPPLQLFLWLWFIVPFIIFSFGSDKGNYYMVVATPALAILIAMHIEKWFEMRKFRPLACLYAFTAGLIITGLIGAYYSPDLLPAMRPFTGILASITIIAISIMGGVLYRHRDAKLSFIFTVLLSIPIVLFAIRLQEARANVDSQVAITHYINTHNPNESVFLYKDYEELSSTLFYLQHPLPIIDSHSRDLYFGSHTPEAKNHFIDFSTFADFAKQHAVYVIMKKERLHDFESQTKTQKFCILVQTTHGTLLTNNRTECKNI